MKIYKFNEEKIGTTYLKGIYWILNTITQDRYIGRGNIGSRWNRHRNFLMRNKHYNSFLQNSFNKYGSDAFVFVIYCLENEEYNRYLIEDGQINFHRQSSIYELYNSKGENPDNPRLGVKWSQEERDKRKLADGKVFKFINPNGEIIEGKNLSTFCELNKLCYDKMYKVGKNKIWQHRGYHFYDLNHLEYICPIEKYLELIEPLKKERRLLGAKNRPAVTEETKEIMRQKMTGRTFSVESIEKMRQAQKRLGPNLNFIEAAKENSIKSRLPVYLYNTLENKIYKYQSKQSLEKHGFSLRALSQSPKTRSKVGKYLVWTLCTPLKPEYVDVVIKIT